MKKKVFLRALLGFPVGITIGYAITIIASLVSAGGYYSPCPPALVETMGNEINAVAFQALLCGLLGSAFAGSSVIWEMEHWSIAKQTGIYFVITSAAMLPIAYLANWMPHTAIGFFSYFALFTFIFIVVWLIQYLIIRSKVKKMNSKVESISKEDK
ncbi:MAG: DUF3021 domain-containing protein [Ruminococcaceae bacterium]|nr:DUF3021 domain-containing protein [Oscillospiraceae bacterium]